MPRWIAVLETAEQRDAVIRATSVDGAGVRALHVPRLTPVVVLESTGKMEDVLMVLNTILGDEAATRVHLEPDVQFTLCTIQTRAILNVDVVDLSIHGPFDGDGVIMAIVDGGIDDTHPDLAGKVIERWTGKAVDGGLDPGHGTMVAGLACGSGIASDETHAGMAPGTTLIDYVVFNDRGRGWLSDVIAALDHAASRGARVACLPFTSSLPAGASIALETVLHVIHDEARVVTCCAAGNDGPDGSMGMPGASPWVFTSGATTTRFEVAKFSTAGTRKGRRPDVALPGQGIIAPNVFTSPYKDEVLDENEYYARFSGTSVSAAILAGIVAKVLSWRDLDPALLKRAITTSSIPARDGARRGSHARGPGIPDIEQCFARLCGFYPVKATPAGVTKNSATIAIILSFTVFAFALMLAGFL